MKNILNKTNLLVVGGLVLLTVIVAVIMNFANDTTDVVGSHASEKPGTVQKKDTAHKEVKKDDKESKKDEQAQKDEKTTEEKAVEEAKNTEVSTPDGENATTVKVDPSNPSKNPSKGNSSNNNRSNPSTNTGNDPWPTGGTQQQPIELQIVEVDVQ